MQHLLGCRSCWVGVARLARWGGCEVEVLPCRLILPGSGCRL